MLLKKSNNVGWLIGPQNFPKSVHLCKKFDTPAIDFNIKYNSLKYL